MSPLDHMRVRAQALYRLDARGRIAAVNQWDGGIDVRFHLFRTDAGAHAVIGAGVPDDLAAELLALARDEPAAPHDPPRHLERYRELLAAHAPIVRIRAGPAFVFETRPAPVAGVAFIDEANAGALLKGSLAAWLPDVPHRRPFVAAIEDGRAACVCVSARISPAGHEAGVETEPEYRRRGCAVRAVSAWAGAVQELGARAYYSTLWDNHGSRGVARRLGLAFLGADDSIA